MSNRVYWGLGVLIFLIIGGTVFMVAKDQAEIRKLKEELADVSQPKISEGDLPAAKAGFKWVPHGDHFHQVPISAPDEWQGGPVETPTSQDLPIFQYKGPLTYHEELLKTNPFEALRLQSKELNHWSQDHIPDYPADDVAAHDFARVEYLKRYIKVTGEVPAGVNQVQLDEAFEELMLENTRRINAGKNRKHPTFTKLTWVNMDPPLSWTEDGFPRW